MTLINTQTLIKHLEQQVKKYTLLKEAADIALYEVANAILAAEAEFVPSSESSVKQYELVKNPDPTDWSNAPEWADYKAIDSDGKTHWYQYEPFVDDNSDDNSEEWFINGGQYTLASSTIYNWNRSLEHRPT